MPSLLPMITTGLHMLVGKWERWQKGFMDFVDAYCLLAKSLGEKHSTGEAKKQKLADEKGSKTSAGL